MAVTAGAVANTTAHADTVNNTSDNSQQPSPAASTLKQAQDQSRQAYANADQANTSAQAELNKAQSADQAAQSNLASATKAQSLAQDAVNKANANQKQAQSAYDTAVKDAKKNNADTDSINPKLNKPFPMPKLRLTRPLMMLLKPKRPLIKLILI